MCGVLSAHRGAVQLQHFVKLPVRRFFGARMSGTELRATQLDVQSLEGTRSESRLGSKRYTVPSRAMKLAALSATAA